MTEPDDDHHESIDDETPRGRGAGDAGLSPDDPMNPILTMQEEEADSIEEGVIRSGRLAGRSMWSAIGILAIPVLLQQTLTALVGLVDKMLAGGLPEAIVVAAMDGVGIGSFVGWFVSIALGGVGLGGQALIARAMGAGDGDLASRGLGTTIVLGVTYL